MAKIAIARSLYQDSEIIIMDEPTSPIAPLSGHSIFNGLKEFSKDKITILITHRLYNLKVADKIIIMDHGRIVEEDIHTELMQIKGQFYKMFEKQMN